MAFDKIKRVWNAFLNRAPTSYNTAYSYGYTPSPVRKLSNGIDKSIVTSVLNKIAIDVSQLNYRHIRTDDDGNYISDMNTSLNECLSILSNKDQTPRQFLRDVVLSMFDEGIVAIVPIDTDISPYTGVFDIESMRVAKITNWMPDSIECRVYNDRTGTYENLVFPKNICCIIENPMYAVMNERNSTLQRLIRKLNLLDAIDEQSGAGKLDLIIQLPYTLKGERRQAQADERRNSIIKQLADSKYGIAYTDGTEKITQLNRPVENNLMKQIEFLTEQLYSQLGITQEVMLGTADQKTMINYQNSTVMPIAEAIIEQMRAKWLTRGQRANKQNIIYYKDPFALVAPEQLAELADKLTRNEILTKNEVRVKIGFKPSNDPKADMLLNSNLNHAGEEGMPGAMPQGLNAPQAAPPEPQNLDEALNQMSPDEMKEALKELLKEGGNA